MGPLPDIGPVFQLLVFLAIIAMIALIFGGGWLVWWLFTHVTITIGGAA